MDKNLYEILELNKNASLNQIKNNFKRLALKWHPDKNNDYKSNEKFNEIKNAYEILSYSNKKKKYDKSLNSNYHQNLELINSIFKTNISNFENNIENIFFTNNYSTSKSITKNIIHKNGKKYVYEKIVTIDNNNNKNIKIKEYLI